MDRILCQRIPVSHVATITTVACQLLVSYRVGHAVAIQRATNLPDKYLKFIAVQHDTYSAEVRSDSYRHRLRFGASNA